MEEHGVTLNLEGVAAVLHRPLREYAALVHELFGPAVRSLTLFGEAALPGFGPEKGAARNVLVVERIDLLVLKGLSERGLRLGKIGIAAPLLMTPGYVQASRDTFPLELLEIQQFHRVLMGEDDFAGHSFEAAHVRLQCERELKVLLMGLRQGLLASAGREKVVTALSVEAAERLLRTIRGMLWLKGDKEPFTTDKVLEVIERRTERTLRGVRAALDPAGQHEWSAFEQLYGDVEALGECVNGW